MVAGHLGIALGARSARTTLPLWLIILAAQAPDWIDAAGCAAGARSVSSGLWSHSLPAVAVTGALFAASWSLSGGERRDSLLLALLVLSHLLADYLTGTKPTWPGGPVIGFALYSHPLVDLTLEVVVVGVGWLVYRRSLPSAVRSSPLAVTALIFMLLLQAASDVGALVGHTVAKC
ncbi:MAG: hypothetical protein M3068_05915 [Gemmatimonadota bacterium]|nr:hypothetical protein [Gemmatimonadota bacterium]